MYIHEKTEQEEEKSPDEMELIYEGPLGSVWMSVDGLMLETDILGNVSVDQNRKVTVT